MKPKGLSHHEKTGKTWSVLLITLNTKHFSLHRVLYIKCIFPKKTISLLQNWGWINCLRAFVNLLMLEAQSTYSTKYVTYPSFLDSVFHHNPEVIWKIRVERGWWPLISFGKIVLYYSILKLLNQWTVEPVFWLRTLVRNSSFFKCFRYLALFTVVHVVQKILF